MSVSYAPHHLSVPSGFEYILESLAREILREQPEDIIAFAAEYFKAKLVIREKGGIVDTPLHKNSVPAQNGSAAVSTNTHPSVKEPIEEDEGEQSEGIGVEVTDTVAKSEDEQDLSPSGGDQLSQDKTEPTGTSEDEQDLSPSGGDQLSQDKTEPTGTSEDEQDLSPSGGDQLSQDKTEPTGTSEDEQDLSPSGGDQLSQDETEPIGKSEDEQDLAPSGGDQLSQDETEPTGIVTIAPHHAEGESLPDTSSQEQLADVKEDQPQHDVKTDDIPKGENLEGGVLQDEGEEIGTPDEVEAGGEENKEEPVATSEGETRADTVVVEKNATSESGDVESTSVVDDLTEDEGNNQPSEIEQQEDASDKAIRSSASLEGTPAPVPVDTEPESTAQGRDSATEEEKPLNDEPGNEDTNVPTDDDQTS